MNKLTILGSGTCLSSLYRPFDYRHPAGYLIEVEGKKILLDCSEGIRGRLNHIGVDYFYIDAICISHFHPDHFTFDPLIDAFIDRIKRSGRKKTLTLYGPHDILERVSAIADLTHYAGFMQKEVLPIFDLQYISYQDNTPIQISDKLSLTPYQVVHGEMEAYAMRWKIGDMIFTYSGDTGICAGIDEAVKAADLFLCEAALDTNDNISDITKHLSAFLAGEIAQKGNVKQLILTHYKGKDTPEMMESEVRRAGFSGKIHIAKDFDVISL